jgi:hypothetical protein
MKAVSERVKCKYRYGKLCKVRMDMLLSPTHDLLTTDTLVRRPESDAL